MELIEAVGDQRGLGTGGGLEELIEAGGDLRGLGIGGGSSL